MFAIENREKIVNFPKTTQPIPKTAPQLVPQDYSHVWVAVIAGGKGTRLFPISYKDCPKQFCQLDDKDTFIQATIERFKNIGIPTRQIMVITTNDDQTALAKKQLIDRGIISTNIYQIRDTYGYAGSMVKAAEFIKKYDKNALIINTPADQYIGNEENFATTLHAAIKNATDEQPVIIGYRTGDIVTAMGCGHVRFELSGEDIFDKIGDFIEKPSKLEADKLIREENTACNTGINLWTVKTILSTITSKEISTHGLATDTLMNKFKHIKVAVGAFDWHDCGTLQSIYDINAKNASPNHHNINLGTGKDKIDRARCKNSLFYAVKGIELDAVDIDNTAVIATVLNERVYIAVVKLSESQEVKKLAERYTENEDILINDLTLKGKNNSCIPSNLDEKDYYVGFVGVSNHAVYVHKDRNGDIRVAVSNCKK